MEKITERLTSVALVQYPIHAFQTLENWKTNLERWFIEAAEKKANFICFPEYGSMDLTSLFPTEIQQDLKQQIIEMQTLLTDFLETFESLSKKYELICIAPSFPVWIESDNKFVNRAFVFSPEKGNVGYQDKLFMTRFENEEWGISSNGFELNIFESKFGNFGIQICYDNEFAPATHEMVKNGAEIIFAPSCTETLRGATRVHVGTRARAMENQCYTCISQTVLNAEWSPAVDINFGYAACYATPDKNFPETGIISESAHNEALLHIQTLDLSLLEIVKEDGQVFNFKDSLRIESSIDQSPIKTNKIVC